MWRKHASRRRELASRRRELASKRLWPRSLDLKAFSFYQLIICPHIPVVVMLLTDSFCLNVLKLT